MPKKPRKPVNSPVAMANAAAWNAPGGGYDQWKKGDAKREKDLPIGSPVQQNVVPDTDPNPEPPPYQVQKENTEWK